MIHTLSSCGFDTGPATYVKPASENAFSPFAGGAAAAQVGWLL